MQVLRRALLSLLLLLQLQPALATGTTALAARKVVGYVMTTCGMQTPSKMATMHEDCVKQSASVDVCSAAGGCFQHCTPIAASDKNIPILSLLISGPWPTGETVVQSITLPPPYKPPIQV